MAATNKPPTKGHGSGAYPGEAFSHTTPQHRQDSVAALHDGIQVVTSRVKLVLRQNDCTIRSQSHIPAGGHTILRRSICIRSITKPVSETGIIAVPIAVKTDLPMVTSRETDRVMLVTTIPEIEHDDHFVTIAALMPAVKSNHLLGVVDMIDVRVLSSMAACIVTPIAPQVNEIAIELNDAGKGVGMGPVERLARIEIAPGKEFLPHEKHGNARCGQNYRRSKGRTLFCIPAFRFSRPDHFGDALCSIRIGVMGFGKDHPLEGIIVIVLADDVAVKNLVCLDTKTGCEKGHCLVADLLPTAK